MAEKAQEGGNWIGTLVVAAVVIFLTWFGLSYCDMNPFDQPHVDRIQEEKQEAQEAWHDAVVQEKILDAERKTQQIRQEAEQEVYEVWERTAKEAGTPAPQQR